MPICAPLFIAYGNVRSELCRIFPLHIIFMCFIHSSAVVDVVSFNASYFSGCWLFFLVFVILSSLPLRFFFCCEMREVRMRSDEKNIKQLWYFFSFIIHTDVLKISTKKRENHKKTILTIHQKLSAQLHEWKKNIFYGLTKIAKFS